MIYTSISQAISLLNKRNAECHGSYLDILWCISCENGIKMVAENVELVGRDLQIMIIIPERIV